MTPRQLGQRWLSAGGGWAPGMRVLAVPDAPEGERDLESGVTTEPAGPAYVVHIDADGVTCAWSEYPGTATGGLCLRDDVPDVSDAATLGAMLGMLRQLSCTPHAHTRLDSTTRRWYVASGLADLAQTHPTEAEAMVAFAEAWGRR